MKEMGLRWSFLGQNLILMPQKALYWEEEKTLIVTDLHIGKVGHFRKAGIAIPRLLEQEDLAVLSDLIHSLRPAKLIFLGDLFHSEHNGDWNWLVLWRELFTDLEITLVKGNHDILHEDYYLEAGFKLTEKLTVAPFEFVHEPADMSAGAQAYSISGHVHPAVKLRGKGRQSLTLPCFYFGQQQAILPAFGRFTGCCCLSNIQNASVFGILQHKVVRLHGEAN